MLSLAELLDEVKDELGDDLTGLFADIDTLIERWLNRGLFRLDYQPRSLATVTWAAGDLTITLPADFYRWGRFLPETSTFLPKGHEVEGTYHVQDPDGAESAGEGRLVYWARPPAISGSQDSTLPQEGDTALVSFCLYQFYKRIAASRSDYERYSTVTGQNAVDIEEIRALADDHYEDFLASKDGMPRQPSVTFYGD